MDCYKLLDDIVESTMTDVEMVIRIRADASFMSWRDHVARRQSPTH